MYVNPSGFLCTVFSFHVKTAHLCKYGEGLIVELIAMCKWRAVEIGHKRNF